MLFTNIAAGLALCISVFAVVVAIRTVNWVNTHNKSSLTLAKLTGIEVELTCQADSIVQLTTGMKKLRARFTMRDRRLKQKTNGDDLPDPAVDPDGWKRAMRLQLKADGRL